MSLLHHFPGKWQRTRPSRRRLSSEPVSACHVNSDRIYPPTAVPPLNRTLKLLIIADPAPSGPLLPSLPNARKEGAAIVNDEACKAWGGQYKFEATVRIGSRKEGDTNAEI